MIARFSVQPLYAQVRDLLAQRIANREWLPNAPMPNEGDLARELGVSPGTMRKALELLERDGLVLRRQGRGTFVADPVSPAQVGRYVRLVAANGDRVLGEISTVEVARGKATERERELLALPTDAEVHRLRRVRSHQNQPFLVEDVAVPLALLPNVSEDDWRTHWLTELAPGHGVLLGKAVETISAAAVSASAAEALQVPEGTPVLILERVISTRDGRPAEWRRAECLSDALKYRIDMPGT